MMDLVAATAKNTPSSDKNTPCSAAVIDDSIDDFSIAATLKHSNVTIKKNISNANTIIKNDIAQKEAFVNSFLARFGDSRVEAEQIVNDVIDAPHRFLEFLTALSHLYTVNVGVQGVEDCCVAIMYSCAGHWYMARQLRDSRESLPVSEIEQSNVPDTDSSVGMSVDSSNVVMGR